MTQQEELDLYRKALVDWEKPFKISSNEACEGNLMKTDMGFCFYFLDAHDLDLYCDRFECTLPVLYDQRINRNSSFHYDGDGDSYVGRQQRVTALKNAISILENKLKQV